MKDFFSYRGTHSCITTNKTGRNFSRKSGMMNFFSGENGFCEEEWNLGPRLFILLEKVRPRVGFNNNNTHTHSLSFSFSISLSLSSSFSLYLSLTFSRTHDSSFSLPHAHTHSSSNASALILLMLFGNRKNIFEHDWGPPGLTITQIITILTIQIERTLFVESCSEAKTFTIGSFVLRASGKFLPLTENFMCRAFQCRSLFVVSSCFYSVIDLSK